MTSSIRTLLPPGGFQNLVGYHVAALDAGLEAVKAAAREVPADRLDDEPAPGLPSPAASLRALAEKESEFVHRALGKVATPPPPARGAPLEEVLGWLDAVRTVSVMVLRPLPDRELERLVDLPGFRAATTLRRILSDLHDHQGFRRGQIAAAAALLSARATVRSAPSSPPRGSPSAPA